MIMNPSHVSSSVCIETRCRSTAVVSRVAEILRHRLEERLGVIVNSGDRAKVRVELDLQPGLGDEGFQIAGNDGQIRIVGNDGRGLLYGAGRFLRSCRFTTDGWSPGAWRGISVPQKPVRGMYFATHFHNFYHEAPIEEVQRYVEDIALWGVNVLNVWFDMHHYTGIADPAARAMIERLKAVMNTARRLGLSTSLVFLANEAYANSPVELRADWTAGHDGYHHEPQGHFRVELCPNKPGGRDLLLRWAEEKFNAFADVQPDYLWIWPYDQGGCTCSLCAPWGANGFLSLAESIARRYRHHFPRGKVILSTWYFDHFIDGEWDGLANAFRKPPDWVDYLLADDNGDVFPQYPLRHGAPGGLPMVNFPEISMYQSFWGGIGANPLPAHLQSLWSSARQHLSGGFPYSEGIFEDINKAVVTQFYWDENRTAAETVREYIAFEYGPDVAEEVSTAIEILEENIQHSLAERDGSWHIPMKNSARAEEAWELIQGADRKIPDRARKAWRWRILYLRAWIDCELSRNEFRITERCEEAFQELVGIYHAERAAFAVSPPTREAIRLQRPY